MADVQNGGRLVVDGTDMVEVKDTSGTVLGVFPSHWGADLLPPGAVLHTEQEQDEKQDGDESAAAERAPKQARTRKS